MTVRYLKSTCVMTSDHSLNPYIPIVFVGERETFTLAWEILEPVDLIIPRKGLHLYGKFDYNSILNVPKLKRYWSGPWFITHDCLKVKLV